MVEITTYNSSRKVGSKQLCMKVVENTALVSILPAGHEVDTGDLKGTSSRGDIENQDTAAFNDSEVNSGTSD